jgi:hypothetical protein
MERGPPRNNKGTHVHRPCDLARATAWAAESHYRAGGSTRPLLYGGWKDVCRWGRSLGRGARAAECSEVGGGLTAEQRDAAGVPARLQVAF